MPRSAAGYYEYLSGSHVLFYRRIEGGVDIVRTLHACMDFAGHFQELHPSPRAPTVSSR